MFSYNFYIIFLTRESKFGLEISFISIVRVEFLAFNCFNLIDSIVVSIALLRLLAFIFSAPNYK